MGASFGCGGHTSEQAGRPEERVLRREALALHHHLYVCIRKEASVGMSTNEGAIEKKKTGRDEIRRIGVRFSKRTHTRDGCFFRIIETARKKKKSCHVFQLTSLVALRRFTPTTRVHCPSSLAMASCSPIPLGLSAARPHNRCSLLATRRSSHNRTKSPGANGGATPIKEALLLLLLLLLLLPKPPPPPLLLLLPLGPKMPLGLPNKPPRPPKSPVPPLPLLPLVLARVALAARRTPCAFHMVDSSAAAATLFPSSSTSR